MTHCGLAGRRAVVVAAAISVLLAAAAAESDPPAQGSVWKWWQSDRFKQELALTDDQSARIEEIFQATLPKLRETKAELDRLDRILSKLITEGTADEPQVAQQIDRVEAARGELGKARTLMLYRMHRLLSAEQREKLKVLHEQWERDRDHRSPHGALSR